MSKVLVDESVFQLARDFCLDCNIKKESKWQELAVFVQRSIDDWLEQETESRNE